MKDFEETILSQYANSPTLVQLITNWNNYIDPSANIDAFYNLVWNVDTAEGWGLDVWGRIVVVNRVLKIANSTYFGMIGPSGQSGPGFNQAIFYSGQPLTSNYALADDPYRALILAKALYNIGNGSIPSINQIMLNLFGPNGAFPVSGGNCYCTDGLDMTMTYTFPTTLTPLQQAIVLQSGVLPRPAGVLSSLVT